MDNNKSGTILYRNIKCCVDGDISSECVKNTEWTQGSDEISGNQHKSRDEEIDLEPKSPFNTPNIFVCPEHGGRYYPSKNQCYQYKTLLRRIKRLLDEINAIRKNETTGICEFCMRYNSMGRCKRCEILRNKKNDNLYESHQHSRQQPRHMANVDDINKYDQQQQLVANDYGISEATNEQRQKWQQQKQAQQRQERLLPNIFRRNETDSSESLHQQQQKTQQKPKMGQQQNRQHQRYMMWISKVKQLLFSVLESEGTQHKLFHNKDSDGTDELTNLLNQLKMPLSVREPYIRNFSPSLELLENLNESNNIYKEVVQKLRNEKHYYSAISIQVMPCPSTCKYFKGKLKSGEVPPIYKATSKNVAGTKIKDTEAIVDSKVQIDGKAKAAKAQNFDKKAKRTSKDIDSDLLKKRKMDKSDKKEILEKRKSIKEDNREWDKANKRDKDIKHENKESNKANKRKGDMKQANGDGDRSNKRDKDKQTKKENSMTGKLMSDPKPQKEERLKEKDADDQMFAEMLLRKKKEELPKKKNDKPPPSPLPIIPEFDELPIPKPKESLKDDAFESVISESFMECNLEIFDPKTMVMGTEVVPMKRRPETETTGVKPVLFEVRQDFQDEDEDKTISTTSKMSKAKGRVETAETKSSRGGISYMLSNKEFIEKGWTLLPTTKIMRKMNVYKMKPAKPQYNWFKNHQTKRYIAYDTGEKLAEIDDDGNGKWYYKNGQLALDYYSSEETNSGHRYVVYSSGEKDAFGRKQPVTVLASFDYIGNGVVYDHYGSERLKYNQTEGVIIDDKIGAPGNWKWHSLNDPPELQPQFIDTYAKRDDCLDKLLKNNRKTTDKSESKQTKEPDLDMIAIELENILKVKANKMLQDYKPYQIKMKALKINEQFALKVLDQSAIYLIFRDGQTSMKLNLGMLLISNEIIDTVAAELSKVATPYDSLPPKTQSIADIQKMVEKARYFGKVSGFSDRKP